MRSMTKQELIMSIAMQLKNLDRNKDLIDCVKEARRAVIEASKK